MNRTKIVTEARSEIRTYFNDAFTSIAMVKIGGVDLGYKLSMDIDGYLFLRLVGEAVMVNLRTK